MLSLHSKLFFSFRNIGPSRRTSTWRTEATTRAIWSRVPPCTSPPRTPASPAPSPREGTTARLSPGPGEAGQGTTASPGSPPPCTAPRPRVPARCVMCVVVWRSLCPSSSCGKCTHFSLVRTWFNNGCL